MPAPPPPACDSLAHGESEVLNVEHDIHLLNLKLSKLRAKLALANRRHWQKVMGRQMEAMDLDQPVEKDDLFGVKEAAGSGVATEVSIEYIVFLSQHVFQVTFNSHQNKHRLHI